MQRKAAIHGGLKRVSIRAQRSRAYLVTALALTTVIPMLCFWLVMLSLYTDLLPDSTLMRLGVGVAGGLAGLAGYGMLRVYPANLERVRNYLSRIAVEDLPAHAELLPGEQDSSDIEFYLNEVIGGLRKRIARLDEELARSQRLLGTIEKQSAEIMAAERQRVMLESLGAACHHIGQPTTVLSLYLTRLRDQPGERMEAQNLNACLNAVESISEILRKLMRVSEYRTVPYAIFHDEEGRKTDEQVKILDIDQKQG
jgi:hypothetical protein